MWSHIHNIKIEEMWSDNFYRTFSSIISDELVNNYDKIKKKY